jgi:3-methyladenine DNA glycosylase AlkD
MTENAASVISRLRAMGSPENVAGMARYGINVQNALGVPMPSLRALAKRLGQNHALALALWESGVHDARILAGIVADPEKADRKLASEWASGFNSWDICDQVCGNLFAGMRGARTLAEDFAADEREFVKRAGFALMATLTVHDKTAPDTVFTKYLKIIERAAEDDRNFVRKAVNWALRNIGKRNMRLHAAALELAEKLASRPEKSARWIGKDAARELRLPETIARVRRRSE